MAKKRYHVFMEYKSMNKDRYHLNIFDLKRLYHGEFKYILDAMEYCHNLNLAGIEELSVAIYEMGNKEMNLIRKGYFAEEWSWFDA